MRLQEVDEGNVVKMQKLYQMTDEEVADRKADADGRRQARSEKGGVPGRAMKKGPRRAAANRARQQQGQMQDEQQKRRKVVEKSE